MQIRFGLVTAVLVIVTELLCLALTSQQHGLQDAFTGNLPHRHDPLTHYFLSRYSPGTSSCGTSCVRTSPASASSASSTPFTDRKSTRLNSSHGYISYAVFCLKKKHQGVDTALLRLTES